MIATGKLDRLIVIERAVETRDDIGAVVQTWIEVARVYSQYLPIMAREVFQSGRETINQSARFLTRYVSGVTAADRISFGGEKWNILHVGEIGRREGLEILAEVRK